jgi:proline dehydrogenase
MNLLNSAIAASLPLVPKPLVRVFSKKYIAGETVADMVRAVKELNAEGAMCTVDVLGEFTTKLEQCLETVAEYELAIAAIEREKLDCNVSIKLTAFGLSIDRDQCRKNVVAVLSAAKARGMFVRFDMEDTPYTTKTLDLLRDVRSEFENVGPVIQAYLRRSRDDIDALIRDLKPLNVRLCKGIYREPPELALQDREEIRDSYRKLLERLLSAGVYVGIATHDDVLLDHALATIARMKLPKDRYEFQMLYGVIPARRRQLIREGHRLRVYVPFGREWYGYSLRRLRENPQIAMYVLKAIFSRG